MNIRPFQLLLVAVSLFLGCEATEVPEEDPATVPVQATSTSASTDNSPAAEPTTSADLESTPKPETAAAAAATTDSSPSERTSSDAESVADTRPVPDDVSREKAVAGVGQKGQGYGGGPISEPARQFFQIRERAVFQIQIPHALKMYQAINGKGPATHDEFMEKIIQENSISLPELPADKKYVFDTEKGELMIERTPQ